LNVKCILIFSTHFLLNISHSKNNSVIYYIIINVHTCSCKVPVILVRVQLNLTFLDRLSKNAQISNFMKIRPLGSELLHADGQTDRQVEAKSRF
jgi:hypothetical protein